MPPLRLGISVDYHMFFDRRRVESAVQRARYRVLRQQGAYLRTVAKRSIQRRKGPSSPGEPPHSHSGLLRGQIFYGYDRATESVVVGPRIFSRRDVPGLLEHGGRHPRTRSRLAARPYMGPALARSAPKLAEFWKGSVKG